MFVKVRSVPRTVGTQIWWASIVVLATLLLGQVASLNGSSVCTMKQKYNVTKRVKYRAPMAIRSFQWCLAIPPRCSHWTTQMMDLTKLETEERIAEVAVCCPGYTMENAACIPICPNGKTGRNCSEECPRAKWGPNCVNECSNCSHHGTCSPITGICVCEEGWKGERCEVSMPPTTAKPVTERILTTANVKPSQSHNYTITTETTFNIPKTTIAIEKENIAMTGASSRNTTNLSILITTSKDNIQEHVAKKSPNINHETYVPSTKQLIEPSNPYSKDNVTGNTIKPISATTKYESKVHSTKTAKPEVTTGSQHTTKFKPKEIWIKPAQKGELSFIESKDAGYETKPRIKTTDKDVSLDHTTPRTIIVSIIPTSIAYNNYKKHSSTTAAFEKTSSDSQRDHRPSNQNYAIFTPAGIYKLKLLPNASHGKRILTSTINPLLFKNASKLKLDEPTNMTTSPPPAPRMLSTYIKAVTLPFNSMISSSNDYTAKLNLSSHNLLTKNSYTNLTYSDSQIQNVLSNSTEVVKVSDTTLQPISKGTVTTTEHISVQNVTVGLREITRTMDAPNQTHRIALYDENIKQLTPNVSDITTTNTGTEKTTTTEDFSFNILTEPEHITAVAGGKDEDKPSLDLVSVLSIAGGVMIAVISLAVVIVMVERCKKHRFEDMTTVTDFRMKINMQTKDGPPPYSRSISHTPLPDPPTQEKCHYQPISTLDRNIKQFMRPVVVQAISPIMLENFRGIIECHYDHLPRRSYDNRFSHPKPVLAPSTNTSSELRSPCGSYIGSMAEATLESLKCEAKFDVLDQTTPEPLYAEIPCWSPLSEHAIEILSLNHDGEAVTEL